MQLGWLKTVGAIGLAAALGFGIWSAMREKPVPVDLATLQSGPMSVTVNVEGVAEIRNVYTLSAAIAGHLDRITLDVGEDVTTSTIIASIHPLDPPFLDQRTRAELTAAVEAARSGISLAEVELRRAETALELAQSNYDRASRLAKTNIVSDSQLQQAFGELRLAQAQVSSALAGVQLRKAELEAAEARLQPPPDVNAAPQPNGCCAHILSPIDGVLLAIHAKSEQAVGVGTPIAEVGNPADLQIVADVLSSDAISIRQGARATITGWGGDEAFEGTVTRVDPGAFTKRSALGIEEQRVKVIVSAENAPASLGHGFRVFVELETWRADDVLQVPVGALFRNGGQWAAFRERDGRLEAVALQLGRFSQETAQVLDGLSAGDRVVMYPNDALNDGTLVTER